MTTQPLGPQSANSTAQWASATCNRSYLMALLRAGIIAVVLIGILALIILF